MMDDGCWGWAKTLDLGGVSFHLPSGAFNTESNPARPSSWSPGDIGALVSSVKTRQIQRQTRRKTCSTCHNQSVISFWCHGLCVIAGQKIVFFISGSITIYWRRSTRSPERRQPFHCQTTCIYCWPTLISCTLLSNQHAARVFIYDNQTIGGLTGPNIDCSSSS